MTDKRTIRLATEADAEALLAIYAPYVTETAITFENEIPSPEEFRARMRRVMSRYPWLVAESAGEILGYAYVSAFKERAAYDWAVETSVYVRRDLKRAGVGRQLYGALELILREQGVLNLNACIAWTEAEDETLTNDSERFHERLGYRLVGHFHRCGFKLGRWYDMIWMEKHLGPHDARPQPVKPFSDVRAAVCKAYGIR